MKCARVEELGVTVVGKEKVYDTIKSAPEGLQSAVDKRYTATVDLIYRGSLAKEDQSVASSQLSRTVVDEMEELYPDEVAAIKSALKDFQCHLMFEQVKATGTRIDRQKLDKVRIIDSETSLFPRVHSSAVFTRGQTQVITTITLGDIGMKQMMDRTSGMEKKRYYLQYTFLPLCVGETGKMGMPERREVGHGHLAE